MTVKTSGSTPWRVLTLVALLALFGPIAAGQNEEEPPPSVDPAFVFPLGERRGDFDDTISVSLDVENINVRDVIRGLAQQAGANIAISDTVEGTITISMTDMPWPRVFESVLKASGLHCQQEGDLFIVMKLAELAIGPAGAPAAIPRVSRIFAFEYADAEPLEGPFKALVGESGSVALDKQSNSLIVTAPSTVVEKLVTLAAEIDDAPRKILIEVLIADTVLSSELDVGINWEAVRIGESAEFRVGQDLIDPAGGGGTVTYNILGGPWTAESFLRALQVHGNSRILAAPKILVLSGQEASIETVEEIPYQELTETSAGGQIGTTAFKEAGVKLKVIPKATGGDRIFLTVNAEQSAATGERVNDVPVINSRKADTTLLLRNKETLVIGGLRRKEDVENVTQVPLLGDIPLLGALFRYTSIQEENRDLIICLTPHLVEGNPPTSEYATRAMEEIGYPQDSQSSLHLELEKKVDGMAQDVREGDVDGVLRRVTLLRRRLRDNG